jgi:hypothetical protein
MMRKFWCWAFAAGVMSMLGFLALEVIQAVIACWGDWPRLAAVGAIAGGPAMLLVASRR